MLRRKHAVRLGYNRTNRRLVTRSACPLCGRPMDDYHDNEKCHSDWNRRCDEEARLRSQGGNHAEPR